MFFSTKYGKKIDEMREIDDKRYFTFFTITAVPIPPPMQSAAKPKVFPLCFSS
jgi:hypothetical protein